MTISPSMHVPSTMTILDSVANTLPANTLLLNELIIDSTVNWQVYNCKINEQTVTQEALLPFLYHYDTLSDELKAAHPLTPQLLLRFNEPMSAAAAAELLNLPVDSIPAPWQVKVIGTLVMFCESLQVAVRLRFTNSAKNLDPIYTADKSQALTLAMQNWHFFGDVFVLNKSTIPIGIAPTDTLSDAQRNTAHANAQDSNKSMNQGEIAGAADIDARLAPILLLERDQSYQFIAPLYSVALLSELDAHKSALPQLDSAVQARLS